MDDWAQNEQVTLGAGISAFVAGKVFDRGKARQIWVREKGWDVIRGLYDVTRLKVSSLSWTWVREGELISCPLGKVAIVFQPMEEINLQVAYIPYI